MSLLSCAFLANARSASSTSFFSFLCRLGGGSDGPGEADCRMEREKSSDLIPDLAPAHYNIKKV